MPSFLKDITPFYGTGERNQDGQSLEEFLDGYNPYRYKTPSCTTDAAVFSCSGELKPSLEGLKVLLVKRSNHPTIGFWALPGGFIDLDENLDDNFRKRPVLRIWLWNRSVHTGIMTEIRGRVSLQQLIWRL